MPVFIWVLNPQARFSLLLEYFRYSLVYAQVIGSLAYLATAQTWPRLQHFRAAFRWLALVGVLIGVAVVGSLIAGLITVALRWTAAGAYWQQFWTTLKMCIVITLQIGIVMEIYSSLRSRLEKTTLDLREKELERERALKLATEAKLAALQSRLHPHFLFNALNSISALIQEDPVRADHLVERMAALLRFSLDSGQDSLVPLADEIKIVSDYLEIEKARFGERLRYQIHIPQDALGAQVPPLSLQTLVENSVKYAVAPLRAGGEIEISAERINDNVQIEIADTGPGFRLEEIPSGHGIDNLRSRLLHLFREGPRLSLGSRNGKRSVLLSVPWTHTDASLSG